MKFKKLLTISLLSLLSTSFVSCSSEEVNKDDLKGDKGETGIKGEDGEKGDKGETGIKGEDGKDGSSWLSGSGKPSSSLGEENDYYLNIDNGDIYQKKDSSWSFILTLKGEDGKDGVSGSNGNNGTSVNEDEVYFSNTLLGNEDAAIIADKNSFKEGETVTFTLLDLDKEDDIEVNGLTSIIYSDNEITKEFIEIDENNKVSLPMPKGGLVLTPSLKDKDIIDITIKEMIDQWDFLDRSKAYHIKGYKADMMDGAKKAEPNSNNLSYNNFFITDEEGNELGVYGASLNIDDLKENENGEYSFEDFYPLTNKEEELHSKILRGDLLDMYVVINDYDPLKEVKGVIVNYSHPKEKVDVEEINLTSTHTSLYQFQENILTYTVSPANAYFDYNDVEYIFSTTDDSSDYSYVDSGDSLNKSIVPNTVGTYQFQVSINGVLSNKISFEVKSLNDLKESSIIDVLNLKEEDIAVKISGITSDRYKQGFYLDNGDASIFVYDPKEEYKVNEGSDVQISATTNIYQGEIQLDDILLYAVNPDGTSQPKVSIEIDETATSNDINFVKTKDSNREIKVEGTINQIFIDDSNTKAFELKVNDEISFYVYSDVFNDFDELLEELENYKVGDKVSLTGRIKFYENDIAEYEIYRISEIKKIA